MARIKIDYGIDLGTTNSAISRMESGNPEIIKATNTQKDTTPSCVAYIRNGQLIGDGAYGRYRSDSLRSLSRNTPMNAFVEFKRTMGTDKKYFVPALDENLSSEQLSAEVLKKLKEYIQDEQVNAAVITVPAAFKNNQIDATRRAASLAGITQVEVLQEPVAAAITYGLDSKNKDGFWLVFDFGGGTFDVALLRSEEGINKVIDTEGDNFLGGKNLDFAIVDEIIIPYLKENYNIESKLENDAQKQILRNAMKFNAEKIKNNLSTNDSYTLYIDPGDTGDDDDGEEIEIDITITQDRLKEVLSPIFKRAIDLSLELLERNNLKGSGLDSLILVGGPTFSPILREMLSRQITEPDTSVDPMTVVSRGAALYASTVNLSDEIKEESRDTSKIQLEIGHTASTVEIEEFITLKILADKTEGEVPEKVLAEVNRNDKAWSSGKVEINEIGELIEVNLVEGKSNSFEITLFDDTGNTLESEPKSFSIIQGIAGLDTMQGLTLNWGIEIKERTTGKIVFDQVKGLEKNTSLPAIGVKNGLKTQRQIRTGMDSDFIKIPLYQGEHNADGTRAIYNEHVYDIIINGADLPALLPENSDVDLTINIDRSQKVSVQAYFPYLDHTTEIEVPTDTVQSVDTDWLSNEIRKAKGSVIELKSEGNNTEVLQKTEREIDELENQYSNNKEDVDNKQQVLTNLRKSLKTIDEIYAQTEWPNLETKLKEEFYRLEKANQELGNDQTTQTVNLLRVQLEEVVKSQDVKIGNVLLEELQAYFFELTRLEHYIGFIQVFNDNFDNYNWMDSNRARQLLNEGSQIIGSNPSVDALHPIVVALFNVLPRDERPGGDDTILIN